MLVTRFAPSPTGPLHLGHAFSALLVHDRARVSGGRLLLRIEDLDTGRCRPEHEAAMLRDLEWLGVAFDAPPARQSANAAAHAATLDRLIAGGLVYRCFRTRAELAAAALSAPHGPAPESDRDARLAPLPPDREAEWLAQGRPFAWRLSARRAAEAVAGLHAFVHDEAEGDIPLDPWRMGDAVLARKDSPGSYHLCAVHDDAEAGVNWIARGEDLRDAAHLHRLLQALLGYDPPVIRHHQLIRNADGARLSKRDGAAALSALREAGATPDDVRKAVGLPPRPPGAGE